MKIDLPYIREDRDRHGNWRSYVRRNGRSIRIKAKRDTPEFLEAYRAALTALEDAPGSAARPNTLRWLIERYYRSPEFKNELGERTQYVRRRILDALVQEHGDKPYVMKPKHVRVLRDSKSNTPEAANALLKALRQVFKWAVEAEYIDSNPAKEVPYIRANSQETSTNSGERIPIRTPTREMRSDLMTRGICSVDREPYIDTAR